jgi:hypothetical protein
MWDRVGRMDHTLYIFIDESGDLGQYGTKYFSIVALTTREAITLSRVMKRLRERRLGKKLERLPEIKANNSPDFVRRFVLERIARLDCSISAVAIPKSKVRTDLFDHKERLYNYLCGLLFEHINLNVEHIDITIDRKSNNRLLREDFNQYIERKIHEKRESVKVEIRHLESHASNELQAVDFIAWAMNRKFSHGDSGYYDLIVSKIANAGKEEVWE